MGILLAAEIVQRIEGLPLAEFKRREIIQPLGLMNSVLGLGDLRVRDTVKMQIAADANPDDQAKFGGNSEYWRCFGLPQGGMHTTTSDLAVLLQAVLNGGTFGGRRIP